MQEKLRVLGVTRFGPGGSPMDIRPDKGELGQRLTAWLEMIHQLQYTVIPGDAKSWYGNPQAILEFLVRREVRIEFGIKTARRLSPCRHINCTLHLEWHSAKDLWKDLPERFRTPRNPRSFKWAHPIFLRIPKHRRSGLWLIDGRRRLSRLERLGNLDRPIQIWVIEYDN